MKKLLSFAVIALLAAGAWSALDPNGATIVFGDEEFHGPLAALVGTLVAGGGIAVAAVVLVCVAAIVGVLFAGLGILMVAGLALMAVVLAAIAAPFMLPLLIPVGMYWFISSRKRKQRAHEQSMKTLQELPA